MDELVDGWVFDSWMDGRTNVSENTKIGLTCLLLQSAQANSTRLNRFIEVFHEVMMQTRPINSSIRLRRFVNRALAKSLKT